jgi:ADP-dependent NAD(P)H-hydrate dehydratase / NAD(P)H-hydrate epimerase
MTNANHPDLWRHALPVLTSDIHKYTLGHALIWGGYPMTGAARLAARAAARMGPGLTTIAFDEIALPIYASALISIMVAPIHDDQQIFSLVAEKCFSAFLVGPGAGVSSETKAKAIAMPATN